MLQILRRSICSNSTDLVAYSAWGIMGTDLQRLHPCEESSSDLLVLTLPTSDGVYVPAAVGSINNTFGCPGVEENTFFFKSITDANKLRRQVSECFERASLPELDRVVG